MGENVYLQGPVQFDYGCFTEIGKNTYANFNFTCLDCAPVKIGNDVFIGPNVSLLTPVHPIRFQDRNMYRRADGVYADREYAKPNTIGDNCWLDGNVTVCGVVTIGSGKVIGAGSVVTLDIPAGVLAAGDQCRDIRECLDPGLYHSVNITEIIISFENFLHIWKSFCIELFRIHFLNILAIHPAKLGNIEYGR